MIILSLSDKNGVKHSEILNRDCIWLIINEAITWSERWSLLFVICGNDIEIGFDSINTPPF